MALLASSSRASRADTVANVIDDDDEEEDDAPEAADSRGASLRRLSCTGMAGGEDEEGVQTRDSTRRQPETPRRGCRIRT